MATLNFLYRSRKKESNLNVRLLFRYKDKDYVIGGKTKIYVPKEYWEKQHNNKRIKDTDLLNKRSEIHSEINELSNYVLSLFDSLRNAGAVDKIWLQSKIDAFYNSDTEIQLPNNITDYIDYYLDLKKKESTPGTIRKNKVTRQMISKYEKANNKTLYIDEVNLSFKKDFEDFGAKMVYAPNTIAKAIKFVKTICIHARLNGLKVHQQLDSVNSKYVKVTSVYLTFEEIEEIQKIDTKDLTESLDNARDWLIISCYTGQRVSDFMRFTKEMIREDSGKKLIEFTQVKTGKIMTLPIHNKVIDILNKRNGEFPRAISDQKYNNYIKEVCRIAGITNKTIGGKINSDTIRKESGEFEKWELVSSHIGRRSFATNYYGKIPTPLLMAATGHSTENMFLTYIGKSASDQAKQLAEYF